MKINNETKLDFDDVLLVPHRSQAASRVSVLLDKRYSFYHSDQHWNGVPIIAANMDSVGTFSMAQALQKFKAITCLHKHYKVSDYLDRPEPMPLDTNHCWHSMGINNNEIDKLNQIWNNTGVVPNICIDVANGYTDNFVDFCRKVRETFGTNPIIMAGNVCTPEMVQELILHGGVDIVKIGIGPGSACTTRLKTGVGYPQLSAIIECGHAAHGLKSEDKRMGLICADGGCRTPADVVKAFAANADFVMLGGMLAGADECEGEWEYEYRSAIINNDGSTKSEWWQPFDPGYKTENRKKSLTFYGMSSYKAQEKYGGIKNYRASEGRTLSVPYKGHASDIMLDILGGIRSACAYVGADSLKDLPKCAEFIRVNRTHFDKTL
jgi:GMP reductase